MINLFIALLFILIIFLALLILINSVNSVNLSIYPHYTNYKNGGNKLTYSLKADSGLNYSILRGILSPSFEEKGMNTPYVDLSWGEIFHVVKNGRPTVEYPPEFIKQRANLKFLLQSDELKKLTEKANLIKYFKDKEFLPKSYHLSEFIPIARALLTGAPYIVKTNKGYQQMGVKIITSYEQLMKAKEQFGTNCIVSEYITNTMLSHGKKFHLRPYFLLYANADGVKKVFTFQHYRMITAKKMYCKDSFSDEEIHMSGGHHTDRLLFPEETDIPKHLVDKALLSLKECTDAVERNLLSMDLKPYPESKAGFQVICADLLVNDEGRAFILEINRRCGFSYGTAYKDNYGTAYKDNYGTAYKDNYGNEKKRWEKMNQIFSTNFFKWVCKKVIFPHFHISICSEDK